MHISLYGITRPIKSFYKQNRVNHVDIVGGNINPIHAVIHTGVVHAPVMRSAGVQSQYVFVLKCNPQQKNVGQTS